MTVISTTDSPQTLPYGRLSEPHHLYKMPADLSYLYSSSPPLKKVFSENCKNKFVPPSRLERKLCSVEANITAGPKSTFLRERPLPNSFMMPKSCLKTLRPNSPPNLPKNDSEVFRKEDQLSMNHLMTNCQPYLRKVNSFPGSKTQCKKVTFADAHGFALTFVKYMTESTLEPPKWDVLDSMVRDLKLSAKSSPYEPVVGAEKPKLVAEFQQPIANYVNFKRRISQQNVCLENIILKELVSINGTVKVLNIAYEKKVSIRITFDEWKTQSDHEASYVKNAYVSEEFDTFQFNIKVPESFDPKKEKVMFCVRYETNNQEFWDNKDGENYVISSNVFGSHESQPNKPLEKSDHLILPSTYCELPSPQFNTWLEWENRGPFY